MQLTKSEMADVIKYFEIVQETMEDVKRTGLAAANKLQQQRELLVKAKDDLEFFIKEL